MRSWIFLFACIAVTVWMAFDSGKVEQWSQGDWQVTLPTLEDLGIFASQGFYYLAILIGLVYVGRKFRAKKKAEFKLFK
ncbi:hypothetical protein LNL84_04665 [Vibrio sp. ZSDZ34]|jgi:ascorbate-specific PTS system EIIC-type component UlaA|uniref:Uncharacterized protein n=1 Tax=Vibrio gelatinilyticus TaxID=2893468 RepID=A0A9X2AVF1_9VIBR|nr:hypothetical protein [Vibrio gelatinilyticus]MCJ2376121.1 hypothetical protein [Vibrio gelatinilyticus]